MFSIITILGFLTIFYLSIFLNFESVIANTIGKRPTALTIILSSIILSLVVAVKGGIVVRTIRRENRNRLRFILFYSLSVVVGFGLVFSIYFFQSTWTKITELVSNHHRTFIGVGTSGLLLLIISSVFEVLKIQSFLDSIKGLPMMSPVFCFGAPAFWDKSLEKLGIKDYDITFLGGISFGAGFCFLLALLFFYLAKHLDIQRLPNETSSSDKKKKLLLGSFFLNFVGLGTLLFVCFDVSYLAFGR